MGKITFLFFALSSLAFADPGPALQQHYVSFTKCKVYTNTRDIVAGGGYVYFNQTHAVVYLSALKASLGEYRLQRWRAW